MGTQFDAAVVETLVEIIDEGEELHPIPLHPFTTPDVRTLASAGSAVAGQS